MQYLCCKCCSVKPATLYELLKSLRQEKYYSQMTVSEKTGIDNGLLSKYESGKREMSEEHLLLIEQFYELEHGSLIAIWIGEKVENIVKPFINLPAVIIAAEERLKYLKRIGHVSIPVVDQANIEKLKKVDQYSQQWKECKPLDTLQLKKLQEYFHVLYTYDSNRIEGNTLTLKETYLVLQEGITIGGKSMKDHLEAINHADAIDSLLSLVSGKELFSERILMELHQLILKGVDTAHAGIYRSVPIMISGSEHKPPEPYLVPKLMEEYFEFYELFKDKLHPVILAAEMHERLVTIHPFIDGNGRVSRLVMNFILLRNGYTLLILKGDQEARLAYYSALEKVQVDGDPTAFHTLIVDHAMLSLEQHLAAV